MNLLPPKQPVHVCCHKIIFQWIVNFIPLIFWCLAVLSFLLICFLSISRFATISLWRDFHCFFFFVVFDSPKQTVGMLQTHYFTVARKENCFVFLFANHFTLSFFLFPFVLWCVPFKESMFHTTSFHFSCLNKLKLLIVFNFSFLIFSWYWWDVICINSLYVHFISINFIDDLTVSFLYVIPHVNSNR